MCVVANTTHIWDLISSAKGSEGEVREIGGEILAFLETLNDILGNRIKCWKSGLPCDKNNS